MTMRVKDVFRDLWAVNGAILCILTPIVLLPLPLLINSSEGKCAYGLAVMAILWITEALPMAVTALLPVIFFPLFGIMTSGEVSGNYIKEASMFAFGGLMVAIAVEKWNLHKRIALRALMLFGAEPRWLLMGFMFPTWFLSMWMSNTATTSMMIPIVMAVMDKLREIRTTGKGSQEKVDSPKLETITDAENLSHHSTNGNVNPAYDPDDHDLPPPVYVQSTPSVPMKDGQYQTSVDDNDNGNDSSDDEQFHQICRGLTLCVAYAANIGGTGALSGTGPNIIMQGQADIIFKRYGYANSGINFASWMVLALPSSALCLILTWMWLRFHFLGWRDFLCKCKGHSAEVKTINETIAKAYDDLGPMKFAEKAVLFHFVLLVLLWFFRSPPYIDGWGVFFRKGYVGDSASAVLICASLFIFPSTRPTVLCWRRQNSFNMAGNEDKSPKSVPAILDWDTVQHKFPWGVLLLIGGGFALAEASQKSGLSNWIGGQLSGLSVLDPWLMNMVLSFIVAFATEVTSNTATSTLLLPIFANLAQNLGLNPLYFMFPCVISASFAFMLPVATPPNAIVFATGQITVKDMAKAGFVLNFICVGVVSLAVNTWGDGYFNLTTLPSGFVTTSTTSPMNITTPGI